MLCIISQFTLIFFYLFSYYHLTSCVHNPSHNFDQVMANILTGYYIITEERATNCPSVIGIDLLDTKKKDGDQSMVKRWSKLLKYSMPSKSSDKDKDKDKEGEKKKSSPKERKSLKDKMKENDFVQFLSERRAVSESRFKVREYKN